MKLKYEFETTELGDEIIAVPVGDNAMDFKGVLNLNASAAAILRLMREDTTVEQIVASLMEEYEGSKEELTAFVEKFVRKLEDEGLTCRQTNDRIYCKDRRVRYENESTAPGDKRFIQRLSDRG